MEHSKIPLTLKQLYQMEGEPVWVVSLPQKDEKTIHQDWFSVHQDWFIVVIEDLRLTVKRPLKFGHYICGANTYGKTWLAYAQKPIDFDEWMADWKEYEGQDVGFHYCSKCGQQAFNYEENGEIIEVLSNFCPSCGRPMTGYAKEMLEKRFARYNDE